MSGDGDLDYALARIAARRARRPDATAWRSIDALRGFAPALSAARSAGFAEWLVGIDADADAHRVEAALRAAWGTALAGLAHWLPARWRPSLAACADWLDLPRRRAAAATGDAASGSAARPAEARASAPGGADADWQARLLLALRAAGADRDPAFLRLGRLLAAHRVAFAALPPGNGWPQRAELESTLLSFLHAGPPGPATAFAWVALLALEHERLRGVLLPRAALGAAA